MIVFKNHHHHRMQEHHREVPEFFYCDDRRTEFSELTNDEAGKSRSIPSHISIPESDLLSSLTPQTKNYFN
jgi:hypothetical protein